MRHFWLLGFLFCSNLLAATLLVNNRTYQLTTTACTTAKYRTIQSAINAAASGDIINICPGLYEESLSISKPLNISGITSGPAASVMIAPSSLPSSGAIVFVKGASPVNISNVAVAYYLDGVSSQADIWYNNASGTISDSYITGFNQANLGARIGIYASTSTGNVTKLTVSNSVMDAYAYQGIRASGSGTTLTAQSNTLTGYGLQALVSQVGIEFDTGTQGSANGNVIAAHQCSGNQTCTGGGCPNSTCPQVGYNLLLTNNITANANILSSADVSIYVPGKGATVTNNLVGSGHSTLPGILVDGTDNTVNSNTVQDSNIAISLCGDRNNVSYNRIQNAERGIFQDQTCSNLNDVFTGNTYLNVQYVH